MAKKAAPKAADTKAAKTKGATAKAGGNGADKAAVRPKAATKGEVYGQIAEKTGLSKKDVSAVFEAMGEMITKELGKKGPGLFVIPGLLKLKVVRKAATKEKQVPSPFKPGEMMTVKAKPARNVVKALPLKGLKDAV